MQITLAELKALTPSPEWFDDGYLWPSCKQEATGMVGYLTYEQKPCRVVFTEPRTKEASVKDDRELHTREELVAAIDEIMHGMLIVKLCGQ